MVASRPSTIALADDVLFVEAGRITAHGTHDELMAEVDSYRELRRSIREPTGGDRLVPTVHVPVMTRSFTEPVGRFSATTAIGRGLEEAPVLRQGLALTWVLAAIGAGGRVVVPILIQQAIDRGIVEQRRGARSTS